MTQAVRAGVDITRELEVVIQALREVVVGVDSTGELEVVIRALRAWTMVTEEEGGPRIKRVL
jgi:hypothetical protein